MFMVPAAVIGGGGSKVDMFGGGIEVFVFDVDEGAAIGGGMFKFGGGMRIKLVVDVGVGVGVAPLIGGGGLFICINMIF
jgi:hypothetical protein